MNTKNIIIIIILIIILVVGGWWFLTKHKPPAVEEKDEIISLLTELKNQTKINFSDIKDVEFEWMLEQGSQIIQGKGIEATRISDDEFSAIRDFFADKDFEADFYNIAAGTISGVVGYKLASTGEAGGKGSIVCHYIGGVTGYKEAEGEWIPPEPDLKDVEVRCGKTEIGVE